MRCPEDVWPDEGELRHLVREAQGARPGALDALLARLRPPLVAYFAPAIGHDDAEDAAQLALLSLVRALPGIEPARALGYVVTAAQHRRGTACRRRARAARRYLPLALAAAVEAPVGADQDAEYHELVRALRAGLATLSPEGREAVLAPLGAAPVATPGAGPPVSVATVRSRRRRARQQLRAALAGLR
jgi:DNA-directed RNA polymerase specialized sigma24 family protein